MMLLPQMTYTVYISSSYLNKELVREIADKLLMAGMLVSSTWHLEPYSPTTELNEVSPTELYHLAQRDIAEIEQADVLLVITNEKTFVSRGGMWVEMGYALGKGIPIARIGPPVTVFDYLSPRKFLLECYDSLEDFVREHA